MFTSLQVKEGATLVTFDAWKMLISTLVKYLPLSFLLHSVTLVTSLLVSFHLVLSILGKCLYLSCLLLRFVSLEARSTSSDFTSVIVKWTACNFNQLNISEMNWMLNKTFLKIIQEDHKYIKWTRITPRKYLCHWANVSFLYQIIINYYDFLLLFLCFLGDWCIRVPNNVLACLFIFIYKFVYFFYSIHVWH